MLKDCMGFIGMGDVCDSKGYKNCIYRGSFGMCNKGQKACPYISGDSGKEAHREEGRDGEPVGTLAEQGDI